jgi:hypothetical protein
MPVIEADYQIYLKAQQRAAVGQRLEMLNRDLTGTKKLLEVAVWPVLRSFEGLELEHEFLSSSGVRIYVDVFYEPLRLAFESEGFAVHAQNITRDRFDFEKMRVRTMAMYGYRYIPFTWDQLDKKPEVCRRTLYELLGRYTSVEELAFRALNVNERELLRYGLRLNRPMTPEDARYCLQLGQDACRRVLRSLLQKKLIRPARGTTERHHLYLVEPSAIDYLL